MSQVNTRSTQRGQWILGGGGGSLYWGDRSQFLSGGSHNFDGRSPNRGGGSEDQRWQDPAEFNHCYNSHRHTKTQI